MNKISRRKKKINLVDGRQPFYNVGSYLEPYLGGIHRSSYFTPKKSFFLKALHKAAQFHQGTKNSYDNRKGGDDPAHTDDVMFHE